MLNICNRSYENLIDEYGEVPAPLYQASLMLVDVSLYLPQPRLPGELVGSAVHFRLPGKP